MLKEPPSLIFFVLRGIRPRGTPFKFKYFREFETKFENVFGYKSEAHMESNHEIISSRKFCAIVPLNISFLELPPEVLKNQYILVQE
jgi:hypothetical protein